MKLSCQIVQDLLPLFADEVCSEQSKHAVAEHLRECEACRKLMENTSSVPTLNLDPEKPAADKIMAKCFRKIRQRWWASLLLLVLLLPICFLGWNQYKERGICFTNLHELYTGNAFMRQLQKGNYDRAYEYIDLTHTKQEWLNEWFDEETLANMEADGLAKFCESASWLESVGGIQEYQYVGIRKHGYSAQTETFSYEVIYSVLIDGQEHLVGVDVTDNGVESFSCDGSFLNDPFAHFALWSEWLWEDYEGCYYDPETNKYVYYDTN